MKALCGVFLKMHSDKSISDMTDYTDLHLSSIYGPCIQYN